MIEIYDNFLESKFILPIYGYCMNTSFSLEGRGRIISEKKYQGRDITLMKKLNFKDNDFPFFKKIHDKIIEIIGNDYSHFSSHLNAFKFSDASLSHTDFISSSKHGKTALLYCNVDWETDWGGETVFYDKLSKDAEIIKSVIPKPGRLLVFDCNLPHAARVPNILYPSYKYTLVNRFIKDSDKIIN